MNTKDYHLAQLNIAKMIGENINDPVMAEFTGMLDAVNEIAEQSNGFVWRLKDESTDFNPFHDKQIIVNFSVWEDVESLKNFVFNGLHLEVLKRKKEWFKSFGKAYYVLWYVPKGYIPTLEEAIQRLNHLQEQGASSYAFDFKNNVFFN
jgi:hypothetical protein